MASLRSKDLLDIARLSVGELELILDTALAFKQAIERPVKKATTGGRCRTVT
jgi:aspartate carbamoyltransferase catalytic subunit